MSCDEVLGVDVINARLDIRVYLLRELSCS